MSKTHMGSAGLQDGMQIKLHRTKRDLTLDELGELVGVGGPYLCKIERQRVAANLTILYKLSRQFGVPVDAILRADEEQEALVA